MKVVSVGKDEISYYLDGLNRNRPLDIAIETVVYSYTNHGYEGSGMVVYTDNLGKYHFDELGHCSCNGPLENGFNAISYTRQEVIKLLKNRANQYGGEYARDILNKMEEPQI